MQTVCHDKKKLGKTYSYMYRVDVNATSYTCEVLFSEVARVQKHDFSENLKNGVGQVDQKYRYREYSKEFRTHDQHKDRLDTFSASAFTAAEVDGLLPPWNMKI